MNKNYYKIKHFECIRKNIFHFITQQTIPLIIYVRLYPHNTYLQ